MLPTAAGSYGRVLSRAVAEPDLSLRSAWLPDRTGVAQLTITQKLKPAALSRREGDTGHWSPPSLVQIWPKSRWSGK